VYHDNSRARGNGPEEWICCTDHVRGEKAGKLWGAAAPAMMFKMELGKMWKKQFFEHDELLLTLAHV
jgi:hypothetical protein